MFSLWGTFGPQQTLILSSGILAQASKGNAKIIMMKLYTMQGTHLLLLVFGLGVTGVIRTFNLCRNVSLSSRGLLTSIIDADSILYRSGLRTLPDRVPMSLVHHCTK